MATKFRMINLHNFRERLLIWAKNGLILKKLDFLLIDSLLKKEVAREIKINE